MLGFRWSKKAKITLETISFWQNISISIFKFSSFLYTMKNGRWNLINFSKFASALIRKEKKHLRSSQWEKKTEKFWTFFYNRLFYKVLWYDNESFFCFASSFTAQFLLFDIRMTQKISKREEGNDKLLGMANWNIYFKSNFCRLIMSITQTNFLYG